MCNHCPQTSGRAPPPPPGLQALFPPTLLQKAPSASTIPSRRPKGRPRPSASPFPSALPPAPSRPSTGAAPRSFTHPGQAQPGPPQPARRRRRRLLAPPAAKTPPLPPRRARRPPPGPAPKPGSPRPRLVTPSRRANRPSPSPAARQPLLGNRCHSPAFKRQGAVRPNSPPSERRNRHRHSRPLSPPLPCRKTLPLPRALRQGGRAMGGAAVSPAPNQT